MATETPMPDAPPALPVRPALAAALAAAQGEFPAITKDREVSVYSQKKGTHYTFKYATLDNIYKTLRPTLQKHGLAILSTIGGTAGYPVVWVHLVHSSGESWTSTLYPPGGAADMQGLGSQLSYLQRYGVTALLGIASTEDDDGNIADENSFRDAEAEQDDAPAQAAPQAPKGKAAAAGGGDSYPYITTGQMAEIDAALKAKGYRGIDWRARDADVPATVKELVGKLTKGAATHPNQLSETEAKAWLAIIAKMLTAEEAAAKKAAK